MKLQDPECMAAIKVFGYLNKPATKSRRFVILPPGIFHSTRSKLVSNWEHVFYQKLENLCRKRISAFKVPSLASLFHRPENKANWGSLKRNFEVLGMQR